MLIAVGVMLLTGWWDELVTWMQIHLVQGYEVSV
jgi:cytochrome c-type biogenesis protein